MTVSHPNVADGITPADVTLEIKSEKNEPIEGLSMELQATGTQNVMVPCTKTNASGISRCKLYSTKAEWKTVMTMGVIQLSKATEFIVPSPSRSSSAFVSSGNAQNLPSGHKIITSSGIMETPAIGKDVASKVRVHSSIQGALFGN